MYTANTAQLVKGWGDFLGGMEWDFFSTFTYRYDIGVKQNRNMMNKISKALLKTSLDYQVFYMTEFSGYKTSTHNHMLIRGDGVIDIIHKNFKGYITDKVIHLPYDSDKGASYYVCKNITSPGVDYDMMFPEKNKY